MANWTLTYSHDAHCTITGTATQTVASGASGSEVVAVASTGYRFVQWSDGVATAARTDLNVTANLSVAAISAAIISDIPTTYTRATLADYMLDLIGPVGVSLGWVAASLGEAVNDALILAGVSSVGDLTVSKSRVCAAVAIWRRVVAHTAGDCAFSADGLSMSRQQVNDMARTQLAAAKIDAMNAGYMLTVGVECEDGQYNPYVYNADAQI